MLPPFDGAQLTLTDSVKTLGITLDSALLLEKQVNSAVNSAFFHLH